MKKVASVLMVSLMLLLIALPVRAQDDPPKTLIKLNLLSPLVRTGSFFIERAINDDSSVQLGLLYTGFSIEETKFSGFAVTPEFRYYLSDKYVAPRGVFIAPFARFQSFNLTEDISDGKATFTSFGGGLLVGTQTMFKNKISLDAWAGPSYSSGKTKVSSGDEEGFDLGTFDGFGVRFGVTVGFGF